MPQCRRWLLVDGTAEEGSAHGRTLPFEFRRAAWRRFPAMESQCQPHHAERRGGHIAAKQRAAGQADTPEAEDVPEALHRLCSGRRPESGCGSTRDPACWRLAKLARQSPDPQALFVDEALVDREP